MITKASFVLVLIFLFLMTRFFYDFIELSAIITLELFSSFVIDWYCYWRSHSFCSLEFLTQGCYKRAALWINKFCLQFKSSTENIWKIYYVIVCVRVNVLLVNIFLSDKFLSSSIQSTSLGGSCGIQVFEACRVWNLQTRRVHILQQRVNFHTPS